MYLIWETQIHGYWRPFAFLKGKIILEATTSDGSSASFLSRNKEFFGFADVLSCDDFFEFSLKNRSRFDAVVTNPPWDKHFLKVFYKYLLFLHKPFVLVLRDRRTRHHLFEKVFGLGSSRTIVPTRNC